MDLSHHNDSLCSLSNFEANQNSNISTVKTDASNKKIVLNEFSNSPLNYSCDKYSNSNSELKVNQQDEDELFSIKNIQLTSDKIDKNINNTNIICDQYQVIHLHNENKENHVENDADIISKVTDKVFMNNSFEIDEKINQNNDKYKINENHLFKNDSANDTEESQYTYSNKENFNKLISDMRSKAYKPEIDYADNESTKLVDQTSN